MTIDDATNAAIIYYTTGGVSTPTTSSTAYSGKITVSSTETIHAIAIAPGYNNSAVASATYIINLAPPSFTIGGATVSVAPGATTGNTSTVTITPANGFTGSVALSAVIATSPAGAVHLPTLSFGSTTPVSITGAAAGTATLTISTTAPVNGGACNAESRAPLGVPWVAGGGGVLACVLLFGIPGRRRNWRIMLGVIALLVALSGGVMACCCGGGNVCNTPASIPGTTAGAYTITVTGISGGITATGTVNLAVQ